MTAVHVSDLRKDFLRRDGRRLRRDARARAPRRLVHHRARRVRRHPRPERVREVDAGPSARDAPPRTTAAAPSVFGHEISRDPRGVRRLVNRVSVEASFFKKMSSAENLRLRGPLLRDDARRDRAAHPGDPRAGRVSRRAPRRADGEPLARHAAEGRARAGPPHRRPSSCSWTSRRPALTRARRLEVQEFIREVRATHDATDPASARTTSTRPRRSPIASGSSTEAGSSALRPADELKASATAPRRSRRRSSPPRAARSRTTRRRTTDEGQQGSVLRARARSASVGVVERNAYLDPPLRLVGGRLLPLDGREHAHDRLHRRGHRGLRRRDRRRAA